MKKFIVSVVLTALLLVQLPVQLYPQAYTNPSALPRTYTVGFSVACGGSGDCVTITLTSPSSYTLVREVWVSQPSNPVNLSIIRRSTLDTGGTGSSQTLVKTDTNDLAPSTIVKAYTVAPTPGTSAGTAFLIPVSSSSTVVRDSSAANYKPFIVQGTTQLFALNVDGATTMTVDVVVTEGP